MFHDTERPLYEVKANLFKGLAHPYRIKVLEIISSQNEASVSHMAAVTGLEQSHLSQHLSVLRKHQLVVSERRASIVYYQLAHPQVAELLRVARQLLGELLNAQGAQGSAIAELPQLPEGQVTL